MYLANTRNAQEIFIDMKNVRGVYAKGNLAHTFLKVPHHGRSNSESMEFFTLVKPKYAAITSSDKNPEEEEVVDPLTRLGSTVYTTRHGIIYVSSDGE